MKNALLKMLALAPLLLMNAPLSSHAEDGPPAAGILQRLTEQSGVYNTSKTGATPKFMVDPTWPLPLPHSWLLGQVGGLAPHLDTCPKPDVWTDPPTPPLGPSP